MFDPCDPSPAVKTGHRKTIGWMGTPAFRDVVAVHREALGDRMTVYFRPTDEGLVRVALHPSAPCYVGFHRPPNKAAYYWPIGPRTARAANIDDLRDHLRAFEAWLPSVGRPSDEERGVIPWLRRALTNQLWLPDLGEGWAFLHQEWRFIDADAVTGNARKTGKSDILAVHLPTGQLGIVEFKSTDSALPAARKQAEAYGRSWARHTLELAPLFTNLIRALGRAYDNDAAATTTVSPEPAALFVGVAAPGVPVRVAQHGGV